MTRCQYIIYCLLKHSQDKLLPSEVYKFFAGSRNGHVDLIKETLSGSGGGRGEGGELAHLNLTLNHVRKPEIPQAFRSSALPDNIDVCFIRENRHCTRHLRHLVKPAVSQVLTVE